MDALDLEAEAAFRREEWASAARHEAAHCVVALGSGEPVAFVQIFLAPNGSVAGCCSYQCTEQPRTEPVPALSQRSEEERAQVAAFCETVAVLDRDAAWVLEHLSVTMAGLAIDCLFDHRWAERRSWGDLEYSLLFARAFAKDDLAAIRLLGHATQRAALLLDLNKEAVSRIADRLTASHILTAEEIASELAGLELLGGERVVDDLASPSAWPISHAVRRWRAALPQRLFETAA
jgi:hypothetical protein